MGDLKNAETYDFFQESYERFARLFRFKPRIVGHDMHPDYLSTQFASDMGIPSVAVQHHHAHIASVMAEHQLSEKVIGISFDGTGFGEDGNIWGGEFLLCDLAGFQRYTHFRYVPLPGGDAVTHEPWRAGLSYLVDAFGSISYEEYDFLRELPRETIELVMQAMDKGFNSPLSSSAGRLFDAVAAILGICPHSGFHAEAPMRLEDCMVPVDNGSYPYLITGEIDFRPTIRTIVAEYRSGRPVGEISTGFHNTLVQVMIDVAGRIKKETGISQVCLSGGAFQNRYLLGRTEHLLRKGGYKVYSNLQVPTNDGGIALGQLAIAAHRFQ
jgi:hydrogenase maturation protein HypF